MDQSTSPDADSAELDPQAFQTQARLIVLCKKLRTRAVRVFSSSRQTLPTQCARAMQLFAGTLDRALHTLLYRKPGRPSAGRSHLPSPASLPSKSNLDKFLQDIATKAAAVLLTGLTANYRQHSSKPDLRRLGFGRRHKVAGRSPAWSRTGGYEGRAEVEPL